MDAVATVSVDVDTNRRVDTKGCYKAAVCSKAVVLLLLIRCWLLLQLWDSAIVLFFCCALLYVHSSFVIILIGTREQVALLSLSSWCLLIVGCSSSGAMCLSLVCDCGISWSYSLTIFANGIIKSLNLSLWTVGNHTRSMAIENINIIDERR